MKFEDNVYTFLQEVGSFDHDISCHDLIWDLIFPDSTDRWNHIRITNYRQTYYVWQIDSRKCGLEVLPKKGVQVMASSEFSFYEAIPEDLASIWGPVIASACTWLKIIRKDWIKANKRVQQQYPLNRRYGMVPNALIRASLVDIYRLDKELGKAKSRKFIRLVEEGYFLKEENAVVESMTAKDYFDYCRIAYIAGKRKDDQVDESLSGRQMYERYADGRHDGMLDIDENSPQEFADWIDGTHSKKGIGGHPWEIKRGGNTTHIDLSVFRPSFSRKEAFKIELRGAAITRLAETVKMFLAIVDASLPVTIADPEGVRKRLLAQDNIGIVPCYASLHRANQHFREDQYVYDVMYYDELGRYKRRITPFITWEPLPMLKPKEI